MEDRQPSEQKVGLPHLHRSLDDPSAEDPHRLITPPEDFQDRVVIVEPPVQFRPTSGRERPKTDLFLTSAELMTADTLAPDQRVFNQELERLRTNSVLLRFPLDGMGQRIVQYRSSRSIIGPSSESSSSIRLRSEDSHPEGPYGSREFVVSETESEEDDDDDEEEEEEEEEEDEVKSERRSSASAAARLSSSSGLSSSQATSSSDADSGIDGVSPRLSAAAFGESTLSPSQSILYIDSISARNSVIVPAPTHPSYETGKEDEDGRAEEQPVTTTTSQPTDEGIGPRGSVMVVEGDPRRDRAHRVALELLNTERTYVDVLHLLDQVFQFRIDQENRAHGMFPQELIPQMFSNIKSLFKLHHDFFLPRLEERMRQWEDEGRIGDVMTSFAPFLKMYAEYVRNFDHATHLISTTSLKCPRFAAIIDEIQQLPECGHLSLQHHMLTPIQRVPRYEMLLRDYLRRLPEESPDRPETERALHLVSTAAKHANEAMKKIDQFKQLLEIQESLGGTVDLVSPTRELLKEGKIVKISARSGDHQERYLFLFTDLLLLCSPVRLIANRVIGSSSGSGLTPYRVRARFNIAQMEVLEGDNLETANTFYLRQPDKTVELYTGTREEKEAWIDALFAAMTELSRRKSSLRISPNPAAVQFSSVDGSSPSAEFESPFGGPPVLGRTAPVLVRLDSVSRCFHCQSQFSVMRRKHHCHSCGKVACNRCSSHKMSLPYDGTKALRVCEPCRQILTATTQQPGKSQNGSPLSSPEWSHPSPPSLRSGLLDVNVDTPSVLSGYLSLKTRGKTWQRRWFALRSDFVLYSYKCSDQGEERAMTATPVPGFAVSLLSGSSGQLNDGQSPSHSKPSTSSSSSSLPMPSVSGGEGLISERDRSFKMAHVHKSYHFQASTRQEAERWVQFLQMAARADLPSPNS